MKYSGHITWASVVAILLGYEFYALATNHQTLSRAMYDATTAWPPLIFLIGFAIGMLVSHFWWRWNPAKSKEGGG